MPWLRGKKWYTRFRFDGKLICRPTECKTKAECSVYEQQLKRKLEDGEELYDRKGPLLTALAEQYVRWLANHPGRSEGHTMRTAICLKTIVGHLNSWGIRFSYLVKPSHIQQYRDQRLKEKPRRGRNKTMSPRAVDMEVGSLKAAFNRGLAEGWVRQNPIVNGGVKVSHLAGQNCTTN